MKSIKEFRKGIYFVAIISFRKYSKLNKNNYQVSYCYMSDSGHLKSGHPKFKYQWEANRFYNEIKKKVGISMHQEDVDKIKKEMLSIQKKGDVIKVLSRIAQIGIVPAESIYHRIYAFIFLRTPMHHSHSAKELWRCYLFNANEKIAKKFNLNETLVRMMYQNDFELF